MVKIEKLTNAIKIINGNTYSIHPLGSLRAVVEGDGNVIIGTMSMKRIILSVPYSQIEEPSLSDNYDEMAQTINSLLN